MSNFTDKQLQNMSLDKLKKIVAQEKKNFKKDYNEYKKKRDLEEKMKLIKKFRKIEEYRKKVKKGKVIKKKPKVVLSKPSKKKTQVVLSKSSKKIKTFEDYFEECIKNKKIPKDTPSYLRKALERAINENEQGIEIEKSSLDEFAKKYIIKGKPGITPLQFFRNKKHVVKNFLRNHRNIKVRFVLVCKMEKKEKIDRDSKLTFEVQAEAYFNSNLYINFKTTDIKELLGKFIREIIERLHNYQENGSGWYFKEVNKLEIHTTKFNPIKGSSYISLPDWIMRKKQLLVFEIKMINVFFGQYFVIFIQEKKMIVVYQI